MSVVSIRRHERIAWSLGGLSALSAAVLAPFGLQLVEALRGRSPSTPESLLLLRLEIWSCVAVLAGAALLFSAFALLLRRLAQSASTATGEGATAGDSSIALARDPVMIVILVAFLGVNLALAHRPFTYDERVQIVLDLEAEAPSVRDVRFHPTAYLLSKPFELLFGRSELGLRLPFIALAALGIFLGARLSRAWVPGRSTAIWAAALLASHPSILEFATSIRGYTISWVGVCAWSLLVVSGTRTDPGRLAGRSTLVPAVLASLSAFLTAASHLFAAALLSLLLVAVVRIAWRTARPMIGVVGLYSTLGLLGGSLPWLANAWWYLGAQRSADFDLRSSLQNILGGLVGRGPIAILGVLVLGGLSAIATSAGRKGVAFRPLVITAWVFPALLAAASVAIRPTFLLPRFLIVVVPLLFVAAAIGASHLTRWLPGLALGLLLLSNLLAVIRWATDLPDARGASARIADLTTECPDLLPIQLPEDRYAAAAVGFYLPSSLSATPKTARQVSTASGTASGSRLESSASERATRSAMLQASVRTLPVGGGESDFLFWIPASSACRAR